MATLDRGFKAWAERISLAYRKELELAPYDPLPPEKLATYLGISLWTPHDIPGLPSEVLHQLLQVDPTGWHGVSLQIGERKVIIYNPRSSKGRRASDIMHETAHLILEHRPSTLVVTPDLDVAMRSFDPKQEDEANWLAWCLLLPREALVYSLRRRLSVAQITDSYEVTKTLVEFRLRITGVRSQIDFSQRRSRASGI